MESQQQRGKQIPTAKEKYYKMQTIIINFLHFLYFLCF